MIRPVPGWRLFQCAECGDTRWVASRDCMSPSGDDCRSCGNWLSPLEQSVDWDLERDSSGNLKKLPPDKVLNNGATSQELSD